ncbi:MAG: hypothetical protein RBR74_00190 [Ignavibacteriaceae bacterium]|jgi:hypothetical protein|nr:hypothetical protein [Ignavibacteriaceae bacterium]
MAFRDQQKFLDYLKKFESGMDRKELEDYKIFVKRQKDDEDFDTVSMKRLKELYDKYCKPVDKSKYDHLFRKSNESGN